MTVRELPRGRVQREWTEDELVTLRHAWANKALYPTIQTIKRFLFPYRSRNSIFAKAIRIGLPMRKEGDKERVSVKSGPIKAPPKFPVYNDPDPYYKEMMKALNDVPKQATEKQINVPLLDLPKDGCHFVTCTGTKESLALMCGRRVEKGRPWCPQHVKVVYHG